MLTTRIGIPSFLTTLAMMGIAKGVAMWVSDTAAIPILYQSYSYFFGGGNIGPCAHAAFLDTCLRRGWPYRASPHRASGARFLRPEATRPRRIIAGVKTPTIKFQVLMISSIAAAVAGMLYAGRLQSGRFQLGEGDELSVIAAAVLGGTSLFGGRGTVVGSIVGALMIGLINNGLILMGLEFSQQLIARGAIIILAVAASQARR